MLQKLYDAPRMEQIWGMATPAWKEHISIRNRHLFWCNLHVQIWDMEQPLNGRNYPSIFQKPYYPTSQSRFARPVAFSAEYSEGFGEAETVTGPLTGFSENICNQLPNR